jgi:hypothetical protein
MNGLDQQARRARGIRSPAGFIAGLASASPFDSTGAKQCNSE